MEYQASTLRIVPRRPVAATSACLVRLYPAEPTAGARQPIGHVALVVGRDEESDLRIDEPSVSRRHARIQPAVDGCYVVDLESTNGTFVNNQRISKTRLRNGDSVRIGSSLFRFLDGEDIEAAYHEEMQRLANLDPLTDTYNRRFLLEAVDRELARAATTGRLPALVLFEVDRFESIRERIGGPGADFTLQQVAARLRGWVRRSDVLARVGGEEFALLLPEATREEATERAEEIRRLVAEQSFEYQKVSYALTLSAGVAAADGQTTGAEALLRRADRRLSQAHRAGHDVMAG
jgi:diguanylate cyclase (GGDEF)-like protein